MRKRFITALILIFIVCGIFSIALSAMEKKKKDELYRQVELFSDALTIVQTEYVDETQPRDLIYGALKGMLSALDPHSQFMDPDTYNELKVDTEGQFGGLGIEITIKGGLLTVVTPIEDTPAWKAGIKSGDIIVKIDNELTRDVTITDAVKKLRGKPGSLVTITVLRESEKKILDFKIARDIIKIKDIKGARILEDGIGYIRLVEFRETTPNELEAALENLKKEGLNALILDLRNNPGGLLDSAVKVASQFIPKGKLVVSTKGRKSSQNLEFASQSNPIVPDLPMVVLINEGSASGSEIVAACLKDYRRAVILGTKSFGKGSVQTVIPLSDGSAIRITTSRYFTPQGNQIHGKGIIPDIIAEEGKLELAQKVEPQPDKTQDVFESIDKKEKEPEPKEELDYKSNNQIMRAVDVLKAIKIYREIKQ